MPRDDPMLGPTPRPAIPVLASKLRFAMMLRLLRSESAGGFILIGSAVVALAVSNSALSEGYFALLHLPLGIAAGSWSSTEELHLWINDGLMALFFLLVGLELRRELATGELNSIRRAALPAIAALGGMTVPALIYVGFNWTDPSALRGWAVPVATDIAFALAVVSMLGARVPISLKVFLVAIAVMDDLGAIVVIAVFYTAQLDLAALGMALGVLVVLWALGQAGVRKLLPFLVGGMILWMFVFSSGVHATLAGVALALVIPTRPGRDEPDTASAPATRLEHGLMPCVSFVVLPLFGLANAGLAFSTLPEGVATDPVALGIGLGLILGKPIGVFGATMLALRTGIASIPAGITRVQVFGASVLCGIGFTMSLFIADLAFRGQVRGEEAKLAVFAASLLSAIVGLAILATAARRRTVPH